MCGNFPQQISPVAIRRSGVPPRMPSIITRYQFSIASERNQGRVIISSPEFRRYSLLHGRKRFGFFQRFRPQRLRGNLSFFQKCSEHRADFRLFQEFFRQNRGFVSEFDQMRFDAGRRKTAAGVAAFLLQSGIRRSFGGTPLRTGSLGENRITGFPRRIAGMTPVSPRCCIESNGYRENGRVHSAFQ